MSGCISRLRWHLVQIAPELEAQIRARRPARPTDPARDAPPARTLAAQPAAAGRQGDPQTGLRELPRGKRAASRAQSTDRDSLPGAARRARLRTGDRGDHHRPHRRRQTLPDRRALRPPRQAPPRSPPAPATPNATGCTAAATASSTARSTSSRSPAPAPTPPPAPTSTADTPKARPSSKRSAASNATSPAASGDCSTPPTRQHLTAVRRYHRSRRGHQPRTPVSAPSPAPPRSSCDALAETRK